MARGETFPLSLVVKAVDQATAPLQKIGAAATGIAKTASRAGASLSLGLTAPLVALGTTGVMAFGKFEAGMANISTLVDTNVESIDAMGASVLAISRRVPVAIGDLTEALATARGTGVSAADQFKVLENSARLGAAALGTTKEATAMVIASLNAFSLTGKDAENVYNTIFQATAAGGASLSELAQGFGGVAGTVAAAGVHLDEYLAGVAALTTVGQPAAQVHTQLKAVIGGLLSESKVATAVFHRLGVKGFRELIEKSGGLVPALEKVRGVVKSSDKKLIEALGGLEAYNAVMSITGNQAGAFKSALESMRSGVDGVSVAFEKQNRTGKATMQRLQNSLEGVGISIGRVVVPVLEQLAPLLERAATWWEGLGGETQKSLVILGGAAAALGPTLTVIGNLATVVSTTGSVVASIAGWGKYLWMMRASILASLVPSITAASTAVWGFTAALLANPITWIVAGIALLAGAVYLIYKNWGPIKVWFGNLWDSIKTGAASVRAWVGKHLGWTPMGLIINNWEPIKTFFTDLWEGISGAFLTAWDVIKPIVDKVAGAISLFQFGTPSAPLPGAGAPLMDGAARPMLGAERAAPTPASATEARVQVDFANLPKGARVTPAPGNTAPLDLSLGYSMVTP